MQVIAGLAARPPKTAMVRRYWNLAHLTIGRAVLGLAIANIFIGMYLSHLAHSHIIAQAVVLGGLFLIYILKNDVDYLLVRHTPAEEERLLADLHQSGGAVIFFSTVAVLWIWWQASLALVSDCSCPACYSLLLSSR